MKVTDWDFSSYASLIKSMRKDLDDECERTEGEDCTCGECFK